MSLFVHPNFCGFHITLFSLGLGVMPGILPLLAMGLPSTS
jgi:hypothetical protein